MEDYYEWAGKNIKEILEIDESIHDADACPDFWHCSTSHYHYRGCGCQDCIDIDEEVERWR